MDAKRLEMMEIEIITYSHDIVKKLFNGKEINFISSIPQYSEQKQKKVHAEIERGLYNVFVKYVPST